MDLRQLVLDNKDGSIIHFNGHKYMIITRTVIMDMDTEEYLMIGIDF